MRSVFRLPAALLNRGQMGIVRYSSSCIVHWGTNRLARIYDPEREKIVHFVD